MKRLIGPLVAALVPFAVGSAATSVAAAATSPAAVGGQAGTAPSWTSLQQTALQVTAAYRGDGPLSVVGAAGPIADSTVTTASGRVTVAQRTLVATDASGTVVLQLALLGGSQLVVDEVSPAADFQGEALVLQPGSSAVAGAYRLPGAAPSVVTSAADRPHRGTVATDAVLTATRGDRRAPARLVTVGGCYPNPQDPSVIGSEFGPLVQGEGIVECGTPESMSVLVSLYQGSTHVGTTAGGSGTGDFLGVNSYYGCSVITGTNSFHTAELWAINGNLQGGATSGSANLHCA